MAACADAERSYKELSAKKKDEAGGQKRRRPRAEATVASKRIATELRWFVALFRSKTKVLERVHRIGRRWLEPRIHIYVDDSPWGRGEEIS